MSAVDLNSADTSIGSGNLADAQAAVKERLTLEVAAEREQGGIEAPAVTNEPTPEPIRLFSAKGAVSASWPRLEGSTGQILLAINNRGDDPRCHEVWIQRRCESRR